MTLLVWLSFLVQVDPIRIVLPKEIQSIVLWDDAQSIYRIEVPAEIDESPRLAGYDPSTKKWEAPQVGPVGLTVSSNEYLSEEGNNGFILVKRKKS